MHWNDVFHTWLIIDKNIFLSYFIIIILLLFFVIITYYLFFILLCLHYSIFFHLSFNYLLLFSFIFILLTFTFILLSFYSTVLLYFYFHIAMLNHYAFLLNLTLKFYDATSKHNPWFTVNIKASNFAPGLKLLWTVLDWDVGVSSRVGMSAHRSQSQLILSATGWMTSSVWSLLWRLYRWRHSGHEGGYMMTSLMDIAGVTHIRTHTTSPLKTKAPLNLTTHPGGRGS